MMRTWRAINKRPSSSSYLDTAPGGAARCAIKRRFSRNPIAAAKAPLQIRFPNQLKPTQR